MTPRTPQHRGFSLIELIVVVSIFTLISSIVLVNHTRFNGSILLGSLAYDIALSIREAQVFGVSVKQYGAGFQLGYGIRFSDKTSYELFVDTNKNRLYDAEDTIIRTYGIQNGFSVKQFCGITADNVSHCSTDTQNPITHLAVVFLRPDPDAFMSSNEPNVLYSRGTITITAPGGGTRAVSVASTGQISVQNQ